MTTETDDDLSIPEFLIATPEIVARRKQYNIDHPVVAASPFMLSTPVLTDEQQKLVDLRAAEDRARSYARLAKMKDKKDHAIAKESGMVWGLNGWEAPNTMSRSNYDRILRELPTDGHRKLFTQLYAATVRGGVAAAPKGKRK